MKQGLFRLFTHSLKILQKSLSNHSCMPYHNKFLKKITTQNRLNYFHRLSRCPSNNFLEKLKSLMISLVSDTS